MLRPGLSLKSYGPPHHHPAPKLLECLGGSIRWEHKEDLKTAKPNEQERLTHNEQKEEVKATKLKEEDDKITDEQMPEIEGSSRNDFSIMLDDELSDFQREIKMYNDSL